MTKPFQRLSVSGGAGQAYFKKLGATRRMECWGDDVPVMSDHSAG